MLQRRRGSYEDETASLCGKRQSGISDATCIFCDSAFVPDIFELAAVANDVI